jgi:ferredoxin
MECEVRCLPSARRARISSGTLLLEAVAACDLPLARACRGGGLCGRCGLEIRAGLDRVSPETAREARAKRANRVAPGLRLACCTRAFGDVSVSASYW